VKINRFRSFRSKEASDLLGVPGDDLLYNSLFCQLWRELRRHPSTKLRIAYTHPMDDGQSRAFKIRFEGEGVDDYGGPYREVSCAVCIVRCVCTRSTLTLTPLHCTCFSLHPFHHFTISNTRATIHINRSSNRYATSYKPGSPTARGETAASASCLCSGPVATGRPGMIASSGMRDPHTYILTTATALSVMALSPLPPLSPLPC